MTRSQLINNLTAFLAGSAFFFFFIQCPIIYLFILLAFNELLSNTYSRLWCFLCCQHWNHWRFTLWNTENNLRQKFQCIMNWKVSASRGGNHKGQGQKPLLHHQPPSLDQYRHMGSRAAWKIVTKFSLPSKLYLKLYYARKKTHTCSAQKILWSHIFFLFGPVQIPEHSDVVSANHCRVISASY